MKNKLKIELIKPSKVSDNVRLMKYYQIIRSLRLSTALYVNDAKKLQLGKAIEQVTYVINSYRQALRREREDTPRPYIRLIRTLRTGASFTAEYVPAEKEQRKMAIRQIHEQIKDHRQQSKRIDGRYGDGVILMRKAGYFLKRYHDTILEKFKKPKNDDTARYVGVEIECILPEDADMKALIPFGKWVSVCGDGSIEHDDGEMDKEIRVCVKREEVREVLPNLLKTLDYMGARVNKSCGLHVHIDQRQAIDPALNFQKLVRSLGLLYQVIPPSRKTNTYCKRNRHGQFDVAARRSRYRAINASAYYKHKTLEVRLFGGTLDATKIINWIEVLHAIVDGAAINRCPKNFDTARKHWNLSDENLAWLKARQAKFGSVPSDTFEAQSDVVDVPLEIAQQIEQTEPDNGNSGENCTIDDSQNIVWRQATQLVPSAGALTYERMQRAVAEMTTVMSGNESEAA